MTGDNPPKQWWLLVLSLMGIWYVLYLVAIRYWETIGRH